MSNPEENVKQLLPGFVPVAALWEGSSALYPSQQSALWAIRQMRPKLVALGAIALLRGRTMIHVSKLADVVQEDAIARAKARYSKD